MLRLRFLCAGVGGEGVFGVVRFLWLDRGILHCLSLPPSVVFAISFFRFSFGDSLPFGLCLTFVCCSGVLCLLPCSGFSFYYRSLPLRLLYKYRVFFQTLYGFLLSLSVSFLSLPLAPVYLSSLFPLLPFLCYGGCALRKFRVSGFSCLFCSTSTFPSYFFRCFYVLASSSHLWGFPAWGSGVRIRLSVAPTLLLPQVVVLFGSWLSPQAASVA